MDIPTSLHLQIVSADRSLVNEQRVDEVEIPGSEGYFGVLPGHTALLALLGAGELWYRKGQEKFYLAVAFGFAEVLPDRVTILAQIAERADEVDVEQGRGREAAGRATAGDGGASTSTSNAPGYRCSSRLSGSRSRPGHASGLSGLVCRLLCDSPPLRCAPRSAVAVSPAATPAGRPRCSRPDSPSASAPGPLPRSRPRRSSARTATAARAIDRLMAEWQDRGKEE